MEIATEIFFLRPIFSLHTISPVSSFTPISPSIPCSLCCFVNDYVVFWSHFFLAEVGVISDSTYLNKSSGKKLNSSIIKAAFVSFDNFHLYHRKQAITNHGYIDGKQGVRTSLFAHSTTILNSTTRDSRTKLEYQLWGTLLSAATTNSRFHIRWRWILERKDQEEMRRKPFRARGSVAYGRLGIG